MLLTFKRFLEKHQLRRYLSDCLDVRMMTEWYHESVSSGMSIGVGVLAFIGFRYFNRVSTWRYIREGFTGTAPDFFLMKRSLKAAVADGVALHKAFARPALYRGVSGDKVIRFVCFLRAVWRHSEFRRICQLVQAPLDARKYSEVREAFEALGAAFVGCMGTYRRKNILDLLVGSHVLPEHVLVSYPVCRGAGTWQSLDRLYHHRHANQSQAEKSLVHLYHQVPWRRGHSLPSLALTLCGWHRHKQRVRYDGQSMSGLQRAILQEEEEYAELLS